MKEFVAAGLIARSLLRGCRQVCDDGSRSPSLLEEADAEMEKRKKRIRTPPSFENLKMGLGQVGAHTFDGLRVAVQKQVSLTSMVSHFYWIGSQATGQPIYQYRIVYANDDEFVNVATDMDFNIEGEIKWPVAENITGKLNITMADQSKNLSGEVQYIGESWTGQLLFGRNPGTSLGCSYVQAITPSLNAGGQCQYDLAKDEVSMGFAGVHDDGEHVVGAKYDSSFQLMYLRRVNPNRVHVGADLTFGEDGSSTMQASTEYILKQSKVNMSVDSNFLLKTSLETTIAPGASLQLCGEIMHMKDHYRFGYGLTMGG